MKLGHKCRLDPAGINMTTGFFDNLADLNRSTKAISCFPFKQVEAIANLKKFLSRDLQQGDFNFFNLEQLRSLQITIYEGLVS